jgi:transcriptional regulator with XRE-family HTH domain
MKRIKNVSVEVEMDNSNGIERLTERAKSYMSDLPIRKMMLRDEVSVRILEVMEEKGVTKTELARDLNTSVSNVSQILNGHRNLTIDTICEISVALGTMVEFKLAEVKKSDWCGSFKLEECYTGLTETCADRTPTQGPVGLYLR